MGTYINSTMVGDDEPQSADCIPDKLCKLIEWAIGPPTNHLVNANMKNVALIIYNDQPPTTSHTASYTTHGHSKGIVAYDFAKDVGFWLTHSQPRWPDLTNPGDIPNTGHSQHFLCIKLNRDMLQAICHIMYYLSHPCVFFAVAVDSTGAQTGWSAGVAPKLTPDTEFRELWNLLDG